jgi:MSHA pilin protein MshA
LIELVMVIVILGVLAAVALPKFVDLKGDAQAASLQGVAGALSSAAAINYAGCSVTGNVAITGKCVAVAKCSDAGALLSPTKTLGTACLTTAEFLTADNPVPGATSALKNGASVSCTLNYGTGSTCASAGTAPFTVIGAAN